MFSCKKREFWIIPALKNFFSPVGRMTIGFEKIFKSERKSLSNELHSLPKTRVKKCALAFLILLSLGALFFAAKRRAYKVNDGFSSDVIQFTLPYNTAWIAPPLSFSEKQTLATVLSQRFTYLGKGARSYAFLSEDGRHVIKFFKYRYHTPHWAVQWLPPIFPFESFRQRKMKKVSLDTVLSGYQIAYTVDREGSGLLYLHLNETSGEHPKLILTDKQGKLDSIDLDKTRFVVQKRVREAEEELNTLFQQNNPSLAKERIRDLFDLYLFHYRQGVCDLGVGILRNNGFDEEGRPVHFDVGKMVWDEGIKDPASQFLKLRFLADRVIDWVGERYPRYKEEIARDLENLLQKSTKK